MIHITDVNGIKLHIAVSIPRTQNEAFEEFDDYVIRVDESEVQNLLVMGIGGWTCDIWA